MSRIQTVLQSSTAQSLADFAVQFAQGVRDTQEQENAEVRLRAVVPLTTRTRVSGLSSPDTVEIAATATVNTTTRTSQSITATNMTACPCMQAYALTELIDQLGLDAETGLRLLSRVPIATHSQRGRVRLSVASSWDGEVVGYGDLYRVLAESTTLTQELLKRPDEYELVRRAHLAPQFVEDVVRNVARHVVNSKVLRTRDLSDIDVEVFAESFESIHGHDIRAWLSSPADALAVGAE